MLGVLRQRDFALLWCGGAVSVAGDWMLFAALPFFVYSRTGSTLATAAMTMAELAPGIVLSSFTGVLADRVDRRRVLVVAGVVQALVVLALLPVVGGAPIGLVYAVAVAQSCAAAFAAPAEAALLPDLVGPGDLVAANAMNVLNNRLGRLLGAPLGGALLAGPGLGWVVVVDAATFVLGSVLVSLVRAPARGLPDGRRGVGRGVSGIVQDWTAGLRVVVQDRDVAALFVVLGLMTLGGTMIDPLLVPWVRDVLGQGPEVYAGLLTVAGLAGIAGSVAVGRLGSRVPPRALIGWGSVLAGVALLVRVNIPLLVVAVTLTAVGAVLAVGSAVGTETMAQQRVPAEVRGRVFGSLQATIWLLSLVGAGVGGVLGERVGVVTGLDVAATFTALAGLVALGVPSARDASTAPPQSTAAP